MDGKFTSDKELHSMKKAGGSKCNICWRWFISVWFINNSRRSVWHYCHV